MEKLISRFMDNLEVSRKNAVTRIVLFFFFVLCFFATIFVAIKTLPKEKNIKQEVILPWNDTLKLKEGLPEEKILLKENQFLSLFDEPSFISIFNGNIIFLSEIRGVYFYYTPQLNFKPRLYSVSSIEIIDNEIISIKRTMSIESIGLHVFFPVILCLFFLMIINDTQIKYGSYFIKKMENSNKSKHPFG